MTTAWDDEAADLDTDIGDDADVPDEGVLGGDTEGVPLGTEEELEEEI